MGDIETERFISIIIRERFDYTKWQKNFFADISAEDFNKAAVAFAKAESTNG